jgi:hypothetical protein
LNNSSDGFFTQSYLSAMAAGKKRNLKKVWAEKYGKEKQVV